MERRKTVEPISHSALPTPTEVELFSVSKPGFDQKDDAAHQNITRHRLNGAIRIQGLRNHPERDLEQRVLPRLQQMDTVLQQGGDELNALLCMF